MNRNMIEIRFDNGDRLFLNKTISRKPYQPKEHLNEHHNIAKAMQWMFLQWMRSDLKEQLWLCKHARDKTIYRLEEI